MHYFDVPLPGTRQIQSMFCPTMVGALHQFHCRIKHNVIALSFNKKNFKSKDALNRIIFRSEDTEALTTFAENEASQAIHKLNLLSNMEIMKESEANPCFQRLRLDRHSPSRINKQIDYLAQKGGDESREQLKARLEDYYKTRNAVLWKKHPCLMLRMKSKSNGHQYQIAIAPTEQINRLDTFGLYHA